MPVHAVERGDRLVPTRSGDHVVAAVGGERSLERASAAGLVQVDRGAPLAPHGDVALDHLHVLEAHPVAEARDGVAPRDHRIAAEEPDHVPFLTGRLIEHDHRPHQPHVPEDQVLLEQPGHRVAQLDRVGVQERGVRAVGDEHVHQRRAGEQVPVHLGDPNLPVHTPRELLDAVQPDTLAPEVRLREHPQEGERGDRHPDRELGPELGAPAHDHPHQNDSPIARWSWSRDRIDPMPPDRPSRGS